MLLREYNAYMRTRGLRWAAPNSRVRVYNNSHKFLKSLKPRNFEDLKPEEKTNYPRYLLTPK